jgi:hypothetical protein
MAEVLAEYRTRIVGPDRTTYVVRACGGPMGDGRWQAWLEFIPDDGGAILRTTRETTQPEREDALYWASGLEPVYLEGALSRALTPRPVREPSEPAVPAYDGPAPDMPDAPASPRPESILDPFSVYRKGEALLRRQLAAMSAWHLVNIIEAYELSQESSSALAQLTGPSLIELIVAGVKREVGT